MGTINNNSNAGLNVATIHKVFFDFPPDDYFSSALIGSGPNAKGSQHTSSSSNNYRDRASSIIDYYNTSGTLKFASNQKFVDYHYSDSLSADLNNASSFSGTFNSTNSVNNNISWAAHSLLKELETIVEQLSNPKTQPDSLITAGHNVTAPVFEDGYLINGTGPLRAANTDPYLLPKCIFIAFLTVLIVSLNTTFIWVLAKYRDNFNTELYSCYNLSIAVADLMMGLFVTPLSIYPAYYGWWVYGNLACKVTSYLQVVIWIVIWCHFMWIGADRYLALRKPYKYENGGSRKTRYKCWIAFSWLTAALITSPHLYGYRWSRYNRDSYLCVLDWRLMGAYSTTVGALILVPTFITLSFTYTRIFRQLFAQYMHVRRALANPTTNTGAENGTTMAPLGGGRNKFNFDPSVTGASSPSRSGAGKKGGGGRRRQQRLSATASDATYYQRFRRSVVEGIGLSTTNKSKSNTNTPQMGRKKSVKHALLHPGEKFVCDSSGTPLLAKKTPQQQRVVVPLYEMSNLAGKRGRSGSGAGRRSTGGTPLNSPGINSATNSGSLNKNIKIATAGPGGTTKLGSTGAKFNTSFDSNKDTMVTDNVQYLFPGNPATADNSSYIISFLNIILFILSWVPWIILKMHTVIGHEITTPPTTRGSLSSAGTSPFDKRGEVSRLAFKSTVDSRSPHITVISNPFHHDLEFIVTWIMISNSMWKPVLYWALDKKFRVLVANLLLGSGSTGNNHNNSVAKV